MPALLLSPDKVTPTKANPPPPLSVFRSWAPGATVLFGLLCHGGYHGLVEKTKLLLFGEWGESYRFSEHPSKGTLLADPPSFSSAGVELQFGLAELSGKLAEVGPTACSTHGLTWMEVSRGADSRAWESLCSL